MIFLQFDFLGSEVAPPKKTHRVQGGCNKHWEKGTGYPIRGSPPDTGVRFVSGGCGKTKTRLFQKSSCY